MNAFSRASCRRTTPASPRVHTHFCAQFLQLTYCHFGKLLPHNRLLGHVTLHRRWIARSAAAAPGAALGGAGAALLVGTAGFLRRPPAHVSAGRVPCMQCSNCTPPSSHAAKMSRILVCCLQSLILPGSTGVQREFSAIILPSDSQYQPSMDSGVVKLA